MKRAPTPNPAESSQQRYCMLRVSGAARDRGWWHYHSMTEISALTEVACDMCSHHRYDDSQNASMDREENR